MTIADALEVYSTFVSALQRDERTKKSGQSNYVGYLAEAWYLDLSAHPLGNALPDHIDDIVSRVLRDDALTHDARVEWVDAFPAAVCEADAQGHPDGRA